MTGRDAKLLDKATSAMLNLAAERPWRDISLRAIAEAAGVPLAELYHLADSRLALLAAALPPLR